MSRCPSAMVLQGMLAEGLSASQIQEVEEHLVGCAHCQDTLADLTSNAQSERWRVLRKEKSLQLPIPLGDLIADETGGSASEKLGELKTHRFGPNLLPVRHWASGPETTHRWSSVTRRQLQLHDVPLPRLPNYEILHELGRGGMGVIYLAQQTNLKRLVAIKMILAGSFAGRDELARFRAEAEAIARLQHPHIVQIFEIGTAEGHPYLSLEYVEGGSLAQRLHSGPHDPRIAAELILTLAQTIQFAHRHGVIHRDLKPANILLQEHDPIGQNASASGFGLPKITDFGLAKRIDQDLSLSNSHSIAGTPSYMAPEQVRNGKDAIGPGVDIYALGAVLYEMLTGRPPFQCPTPYETLLQVVHQEVVPPRQLQPTLPVDLETICLKCLRKEAAKRYQAASELADDLQRFLTTQPIQARRFSARERLGLWCRRNPVPAVLAAMVVMTMLIGTTAASFFAIRANANFQQAKVNHEKAIEEKQEAETARDQAQAARQQMRRNLYFAEMHLAEHSKDFNRSLTKVGKLLDHWRPAAGQTDLRQWEWYYLDSLRRQEERSLGHGAPVHWASYDHGGRRLATACADGAVRIWDLDGNLLEIFDCSSGPLRSVAWAPDDAMLASIGDDGQLRLWSVETGELVKTIADAPQTARSVDWNPDGTRIAVAAASGVQVWDPVQGSRELTISCQVATVHCVAWSPDGSLLGVAGFSGVQVFSSDGKALWRRGFSRLTGAIAWSPDGASIAAGGSDLTIRLLDSKSGKTKAELLGHRHFAAGLCWLPDGKALLSSGLDHSVRIWSVQYQRLTHTFLGHRDEVFCVAYNPHTDQIASASTDGTVRIWQSRVTDVRNASPLHAVTWSPDSQKLAVADSTGAVHIVDREAMKFPSPQEKTGGIAKSVRWSPTGDCILSANRDGSLHILSGRDGSLIRRLEVSNSPGRDAAWSPDGKRAASASEDGVVRIWDAADWKILRTLPSRGDTVASSVAWSPNGKLLAIGGGHLQLWDPGTGQKLATLIHGGSKVERIAWSPDGQYIAAGNRAGEIVLWDVVTQTPTRVLAGTRDWIKALCWSADGERLASCTLGSGVLVWDVKTGEQALSIDVSGDLVCLAWSPDGCCLAGVTENGSTLICWDATASLHWHHSPEKLTPSRINQRLEEFVSDGEFRGALLLAEEFHQRLSSDHQKRASAEMFQNLARCFRDKGQVAESARLSLRVRTLYEQALAANPDDELTLRDLTDLVLADESSWHAVSPGPMASKGSTLILQPDRSVLASGHTPESETYELTMRCPLTRVTALRLETLPHPSLPNGGSGRFPRNGNFLLSSLQVAVCDTTQPSKQSAVSLSNAVVDFSTTPFCAQSLIDGSKGKSWDTFPRQRVGHWLIVQLQNPIELKPNQVLRVKLHFHDAYWKQHSLGRFRLTVTNDELAYLRALVKSVRPTSQQRQAWLGAAYFLTGHADMAAQTFRRNHSSSQGTNGIDCLWMALIYASTGNQDQARTWYEHSKHLPADGANAVLRDELIARIRALWHS